MEPGQPQFLEIDVTPLEAFRNSHPEVASQTQELLRLEWVLFSLISHGSECFTAFTPYCVQQIHEYHREAALLCMRGPANTGLALTRMACELSRDVLRLARDKQAEASWSSRRIDFKKYKDLFKFHKDSPAEKMLFDVYKMSSDFGVHGHILFTEPHGGCPTERQGFPKIGSGTTFQINLFISKFGSNAGIYYGLPFRAWAGFPRRRRSRE